MLHGLSITCLDCFLGRIFSQFVRTRMGVLGIDTFNRASSFPGSFRPCAGLQGVNYAVWPWYHLFGPLFGPHFFTLCADKNGVLGIDTFSRACSFPGSFRACAGPIVDPQGVNYGPWPGYHLFGPLFGPHFFTLCADKNGVLGIDTFSRGCSFPGSFWPCAGPQDVNYAVWPWYHLFG